MISYLRLPSSAALMIIACHKRSCWMNWSNVGGQNKRIYNDAEEIKSLLDLVRTTQISSTVRGLKVPNASITHNDTHAK